MTARARHGSGRRAKPRAPGSRLARNRRSPNPASTSRAEFSVIVARWADGRHAFWDSPDNVHRERNPSPVDRPVQRLRRARRSRRRGRRRFVLLRRLIHVGVLTVEFFASEIGPVVNEIAPRVHNSGHWTIEGAVTSQFEQHIRAICDLPPGSTELAGAGATMDNLIGDEVNRWPELVADRALTSTSMARAKPGPAARWGMSRAFSAEAKAAAVGAGLAKSIPT